MTGGISICVTPLTYDILTRFVTGLWLEPTPARRDGQTPQIPREAHAKTYISASLSSRNRIVDD
ncbi:hypothetical protein FHS83_000627 [Rhizomicrobium palustre]|uniref:Uncharacterized protein n=1 Tax=Rhizomicrobium palustre TaxID=189966 RepID=A0A846MVR5_9PROT|nr:hypothetical protein [Rhizomicrobium palustre]